MSPENRNKIIKYYDYQEEDEDEYGYYSKLRQDYNEEYEEDYDW